MGFIRKHDSYVAFTVWNVGICVIVVAKVSTDPSVLIEPDGPWGDPNLHSLLTLPTPATSQGMHLDSVSLLKWEGPFHTVT